jgi:hypothetical protein
LLSVKDVQELYGEKHFVGTDYLLGQLEDLAKAKL